MYTVYQKCIHLVKRFSIKYHDLVFRSPGPIAFTLGPISIHWYGIIIACGIVLCYFYAIRGLKRRKLSAKPIDDMALWVIIGGIIGARLYYVLFDLSSFTAHPLEILQIWKGGLAIHGALLGGALAYTIYVLKHKLSWFLYADVIIPGILLAQALGRFGNFFNNEAFGRPTDLPWKLFIPTEFRPEQYKDFSYFHPTFLYESLWNLLGFCLLFYLARKLYHSPTYLHTYIPTFQFPPGLVFFTYLTWYSLGRFFIESLRTDSLYLGTLRIAQLMSVFLFVTGVLGLIYLAKQRRLKNLNT